MSMNDAPDARRETPSAQNSADDAGTMSDDQQGESSERRVEAEERQRRVALAAYYIAERRGLQAGFELDDWLAAEQQIDQEARTQSR